MEKLTACDLKQSDFDPCLFIGSKVILVMYVDDILMWSTHEKHIYELRTKLCKQGVDLEEGDNAASFLEVKLTKHEKSGQTMPTQEGLTDQIIKALCLDETSNPFQTSCIKVPLTKD